MEIKDKIRTFWDIHVMCMKELGRVTRKTIPAHKNVGSKNVSGYTNKYIT